VSPSISPPLQGRARGDHCRSRFQRNSPFDQLASFCSPATPRQDGDHGGNWHSMTCIWRCQEQLIVRVQAARSFKRDPPHVIVVRLVKKATSRRSTLPSQGRCWRTGDGTMTCDYQSDGITAFRLRLRATAGQLARRIPLLCAVHRRACQSKMTCSPDCYHSEVESRSFMIVV
jgi:hypothetical protein